MDANDYVPQRRPVISEQQPEPKHKRWFLWAIVGVVVLMLGVGYIALHNKQVNEKRAQETAERLAREAQAKKAAKAAEEAKKAEDKAAAEVTKDAAPVCADEPTAAMRANIKTTLDSQNTAAFSAYFSDPVTLVIAATEKGGAESPDQAARDMAYANIADGPWDFNLPEAVRTSYDAGPYSTYFDTKTYIGRATSGQVVAFTFNCNGQIKQAFLAGSEDMLIK